MTFVCHNMPEISLQTCLQNCDKNDFRYHFRFATGFNASLIDEVQELSKFCLNMLSHPDKHEMQGK